MGVQGLWSLVGPAARPVQLESLRNRKMAIDASIWIHQFMRTMRDKEGNALRNGHLLGFFRRLCKLLFYNIKPVFVFDGGAPALKRLTIRERRRRREGIVTNMKRTAEKILSAQVKTRVLLEEEKRRKIEQTAQEEQEENKEEDYVYMEELGKSAALEELRQKRKRDQYELPPMPNETPMDRIDARLATQEELIDFINQYRPGTEEIDSEAFMALPPEIQYEIIQDLKLKSRQTSWARLEEMVRQSRTALDFSKQQIKQLMHRNDMTQRMLQMNDVANRSNGSPLAAPTRIAGERSREYILVKNENLEEGLGWRLPGLGPSSAMQNGNEEKEGKSQEKYRPEPPKEVLSEMREEPVQRSGDKVRDAVAANPKLAALLSAFESDEEEEDEEMEQVDISKKEHKDEENEEDDQPLFLNQTSKQAATVSEEAAFVPSSDEEDDLVFLDQQDRRKVQGKALDTDSVVYGERSDNQDNHDEALHRIIQQIYDQDELEAAAAAQQVPKEDMDESTLSAQDFYDLWLSRVPDAFLYQHSLNDEYKHILRDAIFSQSKDEIQTMLKKVEKGIGKSNGRDTLALESMSFHQEFLKNALKWKERNEPKPSPQQPTLREILDEQPPKSDATTMVLEDRGSYHRHQQQESKKEENNVSIVSDLHTEEKEPIRSAHAPSQQPPPETTMHISLSPESTDYVVDETEGDRMSVDDSQTQSKETFKPFDERNTEIYQQLDNQDVKQDLRDDGGRLPEAEETHEDITGENRHFQVALEQDITDTVKEEETIPANPDGVPDNQGYNSDEELLGDVEAEESEYARFVSDIADKDLESVREELYRDLKELNKQQRKEMGNTDDVTNQMVQDIQEMLRLFGIPYVVSPMEAEAQCAELVRLSLVEGIVTDDSDVFLFGATRVYKNMFNQQKYVECYLTQDVETEMHLDRKKLIQLAYLLGSDYTDGIPGVGPVAAMEILAEFCKPDDKDILTPLQRFRSWYESGRDETDFQKKFRKKHKHLEFPDEFPNPLVVEAYYHPMVDSSPQQFEWGTPQLDSLRLFLMESFTWPEKKADEVLIPIIREMNKRKTVGQQSNIASFFDSSGGTSSTFTPHKRKPHSSKRVQKIVNQWRRQDEGSDEQKQGKQASTDKRKTKRVRRN